MRDKTLVTWVVPANLEQRGGSVLTFDAGQGRFEPKMGVGEGLTPECPDLFHSGDFWYLLYTRHVQNIRYSKNLFGPYVPCEPTVLDGRLLAGNRLFDGTFM